MSACSDDDVDALILSFAQVQWRKVAMIMSQVVDACSCRGGDADLHHIAERICALFEDGQLEAQGDFVDVATQRGKAARRHRGFHAEIWPPREHRHRLGPMGAAALCGRGRDDLAVAGWSRRCGALRAPLARTYILRIMSRLCPFSVVEKRSEGGRSFGWPRCCRGHCPHTRRRSIAETADHSRGRAVTA